ncbi:permease-like cell division protein FtsX [Actinoplanes solisilvae]|uniref:permease-like cell division protein FtsX n=1 Tax=Actinoplanes solisilvae TaxID=2486853 RepID=UPI000FD9242C|nr:permease-like cell division protein FtsX [Actinoplanes solisilvae]
MTEQIIDVAAPAPMPPRGQWIPLLIAAVAVVSLLVGAGATGSALFMAGWRPPAVQQYTLLIVMKPDATTDQTAAVDAVLRKVPDGGELVFHSKAQAIAKMKEIMGDVPLPDTMSEATASEYFELPVRTNRSICDGVPEISKMSGVKDAGVEKAPTATEPKAAMFCR